MRVHWILGFAIVLALGCGGKKSAPVSGTVTLNGKPLANATVTFQPIPDPGSIEAGDSSTGKTDEKGQFTLTTSKGKPGALVCKHRVSISVLDPKIGEGDQRPPRGGWPLADKVPARYGMGQKDELSFVVPSGGTDKADFALTSP